MRVIILPVLLVLGSITSAAGQPARLELGPLFRVDHVFIEGDAGGATAVAGLTTGIRLSKTFGVDAELTWAANRIERSYEGWFISYSDNPNATRDEIERLAPIARRSLGYEPGIGGAAAFVARGQVNPRVSIAARVGVSARRYVETSAYTVLAIPEGVDPARVARDFQNESRRRTRGGILLGLDVPIVVTDRLVISPEVRFVYGGPARVGSKHRELGVGLRGGWRF